MHRALTLRSLAVLMSVSLTAPAFAAEAEKKAADEKKEKEEETAKAARASLADKIPPISGNLWAKKGRFEITPNVGFSLGDAFFQKYAFGLKLNYHFYESFAVGLHGSYAVSTPGSAVSVCKSDNSCSSPTMDDLKDVPGKVSLLAGLDLNFSPIYGKVNVLAEKVLHFDVSVLAGVDLVQYMQPGGSDTFTVGGHVGIGQRYFITPMLVLRIELRDYIYSSKIVRLGDSDSKIENQLMLDIGLSFLLGGSRE
jgi:outer membrane beta-barrel protein